MNRIPAATSLLLALLMFISPLAAAAAEKPERIFPKGDPDLCNELSNVSYAATWAGGKVTITATGKHNTGGFEVSFRQSPLRIYPPQYNLVHKRPEGIVTQAITPFTATTTLEAAEKPAAVTVHDAQGPHEVPVK